MGRSVPLVNDRIAYVVDDDKTVRDSLNFLMHVLSVRCRCFSGGAAFLAASNDLSPGCVLLDLQMPDMDGLAVQQRIAGLSSRLPVILMTADNDVATTVRALQLGVVDYLEKPFDEGALGKALESGFALVEGRTSVRERCSHASDLVGGLSAPDALVLRGMIAGLPNSDIAGRLGLHPIEVRRARARVKQRLGASSFHEALLVGVAAGVAPLDGDGAGIFH